MWRDPVGVRQLRLLPPRRGGGLVVVRSCLGWMGMGIQFPIMWEGSRSLRPWRPGAIATAVPWLSVTVRDLAGIHRSDGAAENRPCPDGRVWHGGCPCARRVATTSRPTREDTVLDRSLKTGSRWNPGARFDASRTSGRDARRTGPREPRDSARLKRNQMNSPRLAGEPRAMRYASGQPGAEGLAGDLRCPTMDPVRETPSGARRTDPWAAWCLTRRATDEPWSARVRHDRTASTHRPTAGSTFTATSEHGGPRPPGRVEDPTASAVPWPDRSGVRGKTGIVTRMLRRESGRHGLAGRCGVCHLGLWPQVSRHPGAVGLRAMTPRS